MLGRSLAPAACCVTGGSRKTPVFERQVVRCRSDALRPACCARDEAGTCSARRHASSGVSIGGSFRARNPMNLHTGTPYRQRMVVGTSADASADIRDGGGAGAEPSPLSGTAAKLSSFAYAFYKFTRPHTMAGTFISIVSISLLGLQGRPFGATGSMGLLIALGSALLMNIFIVGLNQVYDIEIDKVNKPYLPLASGEFSLKTGLVIVGVSGILSLIVGSLAGSPPLMATLVLSMVLGIGYSMDVPFLRWKKNAFFAACCVMMIRAVAVQLGFYFHIQRSVGVLHLAAPRPLLITMFLMLFFAAVIALFKDIPDVRGDEESGMNTFSVQLGQNKVFWICISMLTAMYAGAFGLGLFSEVFWSQIAFPASQAFLACVLWIKALKVDTANKEDIVSFYMFIWKLFYSEYLFIPLLR